MNGLCAGSVGCWFPHVVDDSCVVVLLRCCPGVDFLLDGVVLDDVGFVSGLDPVLRSVHLRGSLVVCCSNRAGKAQLMN